MFPAVSHPDPAAGRHVPGWVVAAGAATVAAAAAVLLVRLTGDASAGRALLLTAGLAFGAAFFVTALVRPGLATVIAFGLMFYVRAEPAPVDGAFAMLLLALAIRRPAPLRLPLALATVLPAFAAITILSMSVADDEQRAVKFEWTTLYLIAVGVGIVSVCRLPRTIDRAVDAWIATAAVSAVLAVSALHLGLPGGSTLLFDPSRIEGLFKDPNVFGAFLVPPAAIVLERLTEARMGKRRQLVQLLTLFALLAGIVFAFSRAAWLNLGIAFATVVVVNAARSGGRRGAARAAGAIGLAGAIAYALLSVTGSLAFLQSRSHLEAYDQNRFANQLSAFDQGTSHLIGFGPGQADVNLPLSTHSTYVRVLYEQGFGGLVLLLAIIAITIWLALVLLVRRRRIWGIGTAALLGSWLGLLANSAFIDSLHWRHLWVLAGLIWGGYALVSRPDEPPEEASSA